MIVETPSITLPEPGIYPNVPFDTYLHWPCLSQTTLKLGRQSMAHVRCAMDEERVLIPTDDMMLGSALHTAFLEPELMPDRVVKWEGKARAGNDWKAFKAIHAGKIILTAGMHEKLVGMTRSLRKHPEVKRWQSKIQEVEVSIVGELEGVKFKGRIDALTIDPLIDLKKVCDGDRRLFARNAYDFGYHIQAAIYMRLFRRERFILMTVEDQPPYDVLPYELSQSFIDRGWDEAVSLLRQVRFCMDTGLWPGRSDVPVPLEEPSWLSQSDRKILG